MFSPTQPHDTGAQDIAMSTFKPLSETQFSNEQEKPVPSITFKHQPTRSAVWDEISDQIYSQPVLKPLYRRFNGRPLSKQAMLRAKKERALLLALEHFAPGAPQEYTAVDRYTGRLILDMFVDELNEALQKQARDFLRHADITGKTFNAGQFEAERGLIFPVPCCLKDHLDHIYNQLVISEIGEWYVSYLVLLLGSEIDAVRTKFDLLYEYAQSYLNHNL